MFNSFLIIFYGNFQKANINNLFELHDVNKVEKNILSYVSHFGAVQVPLLQSLRLLEALLTVVYASVLLSFSLPHNDVFHFHGTKKEN